MWLCEVWSKNNVFGDNDVVVVSIVGELFYIYNVVLVLDFEKLVIFFIWVLFYKVGRVIICWFVVCLKGKLINSFKVFRKYEVLYI